MVLGFGNPLLDVTISAPPARMASLGLKPGTHASTLPDDTKHAILHAALSDPTRVVSAGGTHPLTLHPLFANGGKNRLCVRDRHYAGTA